MNQEHIQRITPKVMTAFQVATHYGLSTKELRELLSPYEAQLGELNGWNYTEKQVEIIFNLLGTPCLIKCDEIVQVLPSSIEMLVNAAWNFARGVLWPAGKFSLAETRLCQKAIRGYFEQISPESFSEKAKTYLTEYLERLLLAKRRKDRLTGGFIPHPVVYLNPGFDRGFAVTKFWHDKVKQIRLNNPNYQRELLSGAELYAEHILNPSPEVFRKASKAFSYRDSNLLLLFCSHEGHLPSPSFFPQIA